MQYRHGDVLVERVARLPKRRTEVPRDGGRIVLAYGEANGHMHVVAEPDATLYEAETSQELFLHVRSKARLTHPDHDTITVPCGTFRIVRQREYSPREIRTVAD